MPDNIYHTCNASVVEEIEITLKNSEKFDFLGFFIFQGRLVRVKKYHDQIITIQISILLLRTVIFGN